MTRTSTLKGIAWMALTGLLFVAVTGIVRHLGTDMSPVQAAFIRYAMGVVIMAPIILRVRWTRIASGRVGMFLTRGLVHGAGVMLWFYAMAHIPIAEVTALGFTAPIFTTIGAALFLGEKVRARRIGAVLMGFAGALIILRPGIAVIDPGAIAQLVAAPLFAASFILAKKLTETDPTRVIVGGLTIIVTLVLLVPALLVWRTPTPVELGWLFATAGFATAGHLTLTQAFRAAEITATQPVAFLQLVWATLLGYYAFGETPDMFTWIGAAVIVASATYIAHRELKNR
ncbi:MAG: DMT family transporter [Proteobacteria bacterium]|nr:DMT family transporter [Pseudomonadota bacterium]